MSVIIIKIGTPDEAVKGPFEVIEVTEAGVVCDGLLYPFALIGDYTISEDDSLAPLLPALPVSVPTVVSMRQARLALLHAGKLAQVQSALAALPGVEGEAARIEWEYATEVRRDAALVASLGAALALDAAALDALFVQASTL